MKKIFILPITFLILILFSCSYDYQKFFFRGPHVDERAKEIKKLSSPIKNSSEINFLVVTDLHFGGKNKRPEQQFLNSLKDNKFEFVIFLGDLVDTGFEENYKESEVFVEKIKKIKNDVLFYVLLGNHDLYQDGIEYWSKLTYSINKDTSYFYFQTPTNLENNKFRSWYFLDTASGILGYNQLNDLKLRMEKDKNSKIVFTHYPIYADMSMFDYFRLSDTRERALLIEIFDKNNVDFVFSGHWHLGGIYDFGNFTEICLKSFCENRDEETFWAFVNLDESNQSMTLKKYLVKNGKLNTTKTKYTFNN